jgi:outer membrane protein TolC
MAIRFEKKSSDERVGAMRRGLERTSVFALVWSVWSAAVVTMLAGSASAQENVGLPMAPSAIVAALPVRQTQQSLSGISATGSATRFAGGVGVEQATAGPLPLSLDEAIDRGLKHNLQVLLANQSQRSVEGEISNVRFALLPNMRATAYTNTMELNLAAMGFKESSLAAFGIKPSMFGVIQKVDTTGAELSANQVMFNLTDYYLYEAAKKAGVVVEMNRLNARGGVVDAVGTEYLAALANQAQIANARARVAADDEVLRQATLALDAGVGVNLDVLRARVQLQVDQQVQVQSENAFAKAKIALNRLIGLPAEQELTLTDAVPYAELAVMPLDQTLELAYRQRKDLLGLTAQLGVAAQAQKAVKFERLPSVTFNGDYGVVGVTEAGYHGIFAAEGSLKIPLFEEGRFRGESQITAAQEISLRRQIASLRVTIEAQIRASRMDVETSGELVNVARSSVTLATEALADARDRFSAGVDDNLPVVQAQAALAAAQSRLVATEFQFNQAKLTLARNSGVVESRYKQYLGH